ncbi:hypothetical protein Drose_36805 [Dactylosporangium roseum]|uniref:Aerotolerance regulator N-terminal domain-containing protein n=1 Tax=Dactylosporangium roseum TaxID=47989 RepID=A0ABY5Z4D4_9ACTN|nr:hypothetical protein [Dactylosporangium roseum]UWZ36514.1 hypothetical protein Drose_36805 [Dactylosporangium roseum]
MNAESLIALDAALLAAAVAIVVPVWTFKRTLEFRRPSLGSRRLVLSPS